MHYYLKNIFRTFWRNKASYLGSICIIALGIFIYIALIDVLYNLDDQLQNYYEENQFAQVFATVTQMPEQDIALLEEIEGIAKADGRLSGDLRLYMPEQEKIISLHILGYKADTGINQITLQSDLGTMQEDKIYIGEKMNAVYHFNDLEPITLLTGDGRETFYFGGWAREPEYIYTIPPDSMLPDGSVYDMAAMDQTVLERLLQKENMVTELGFFLQPGYSFADVQAQLEAKLKPYGLQSLTDRESQSSYNMLQSEYNELRTIGGVVPAIFMLISVFMMYIVLRKMIFQERGRIGTMKAFGFTDRELIGAYLKQSFLTGVLGAIVGGILAIPLGIFLYEMYLDYFSLPGDVYQNYWSTRLIGLLIGTATSVLSTYLGVREILCVMPAEAMRPASPPVKKQLRLGRGVFAKLRPQQKMALQTIYQNKLRSIVIALAVAFPFAMVAVLSSFDGVVDKIFTDQFTWIQTYDYKVTLQQYDTPERVVASARQLDGVYQAEPLGTVAVTLQHENRKEMAALYFLPEASELFHVMDSTYQEYQPRADGVILNTRIAKKMHLATGDLVQIESSWLCEDAVTVPVVAVVEETFGGGCYMLMEGCRHVFHREPFANAVMYRAFDNSSIQTLSTEGKITGMTDAERTMTNQKAMMGSMMILVHMFSLLAVAAGFILIYNVLGISLRERRNEFGTLMILGANDKEISNMIISEQLIHYILGLILGLPMIVALTRLMESLVSEELYTLHLTLAPWNYVLGALVALVVIVGSTALLVREQLRFDPTELLRERE